MLKTNLNYFYSMISDENMNTNKNFYKEGMTREEIKKDFTERRIKLGKQYGFDGLKILTPIQKSRPVLDGKTIEEQHQLIEKYNSKYQDGYAVRITKEMIEEYNDLYDLDIYSDILMIGSEISNVALAYPVADCPVVFAEDTKNKVVAMAHCGGEYIDRELPSQVIEALRNETDAKKEDITVYVGPHASKESFTYDCYPKFVKNFTNWKECIYYQEDCLYHIDMETAIRKQLYKQGVLIENINVSNIDTITDPRFYSNNRARFDKTKAGRFYTGCFYSEKGQVLRK